MAASSQNRSEGGGESRVQCLYCGANNFPSSPTCWQCGRPLQALRAGPSVAPGPSLGRQMQATSRSGSLPDEDVSPTLAPKAAAALGLMFPYVGLPVGMVFLMLDDARKTQIGWIMIGWSVAGSIANGLLLLATLGPTVSMLKGFIPNSGHGGIPSLPSPSGDPSDVNLILPYLGQTLLIFTQANWLKLAFCSLLSRV